MKKMKVLTSLISLCTSLTVLGQMSDTLFDKQWPLVNKGQTILRRSGELTRAQVNGVPGKDINWLKPKELQEKYNLPKEREVVVAVLDSGLDLYHPDLEGKVFYDKELCPEGEDNSDKPCQGINILKKNNDLTDDTGHGTHVAGIIAAKGNNSLGIHGLSDDRIKILPIKVLSKETTDFIYEGRLITDIFADGIVFAIQRGADVINMSIGWPKVVETPKMKRALSLAAQRDIPVVVAAGNNNKEIPTYPCTTENVICVGAVDNQGLMTEFSNYGGKVDILAPGEFIVSTYPQESVESRILRIRGYESLKGTSQASPFVAGIAASLKLLNPDMSLDELRARLFSSADKANLSQKEGKFSKYGLVNMTEAMDKKPQQFAMPIYKDLLDLNYSIEDGSFFFSLPVKSLAGDFENLKVKASFNRKDIALESSEQLVSLREGDKRSVLFRGRLKTLSGDSHFRLSIRLYDGENEISSTQTTLIFARDLSREMGRSTRLIKEEMPDFKAEDLTFFRGVRKALRIKKVDDSAELSDSPLFYTLKNDLQSESASVVTIVKREGKSWHEELLELPKRNEITHVVYRDLNFDGIGDFLVAGLNEEQNRVTLDYFFKKANGIQKKTLLFPLLDYKGFPVEYDVLTKNSFIRVKDLLVPAFYAQYTMPEQDNSQDILDRIPDHIKSPHLYYLWPKSENGQELELRALDSYDLLEGVKERFQVEPWQPLMFEKPFPQSTEDMKRGRLRGFISAGEEFLRRYFYYEIEGNKKTFEEVYFPHHLVAGNTAKPIISVEKETLGQVTEEVEFLALLERDQVRSFSWDPKTHDGSSLLISTNNWSDPVFNTISSFNDEGETRFIETRYFLQFFNQAGETDRLRINRESSFPGVQFSETLEPVLVGGEAEKLHPGIFINSTLIFGNRLYTMMKKDQDFLRPVEFSVDIPGHCVHMKPAKIDGVYNYLMLCREGQGKVSLLRMPLTLSQDQLSP